MTGSKGLRACRGAEGVHSAEFTDGEIAEIIAHVALNIFTDYLTTRLRSKRFFPELCCMRAPDVTATGAIESKVYRRGALVAVGAATCM